MTEALVDEIIGEADPVLRNLRISAAYGRLAEESYELVDPHNGTWVQFAAWTSEDVGQAIRGEQTDKQPLLRLMRRFRKDYDELAAAAAEAFSEGNTLVFDQVGRSVVGLHTALRAEDDDAVEEFLNGLDTEVQGGGEVPEVTLADAFGAYVQAARADPTANVERAHGVALGNLALAVIEQSRVQPQLDVAFGILAAGWPFASWTKKVASRLVTEFALGVTMGDVHIRPGKGLPPGLSVPDDLVDLVVEDDRFRAYSSVLPPDPPDSERWTELADRVTFIAALMPLLQQSPRLLGTSPFTDSERDEIEGRQIPGRFGPATRRP